MYLNDGRGRGRWRSLPPSFVGFDVAPYGPANAMIEGRAYEMSILHPTGERGPSTVRGVLPPVEMCMREHLALQAGVYRMR